MKRNLPFQHPANIPVAKALVVYRIMNNKSTDADWTLLDKWVDTAGVSNVLKDVEAILKANAVPRLQEEMAWWKKQLVEDRLALDIMEHGPHHVKAGFDPSELNDRILNVLLALGYKIVPSKSVPGKMLTRLKGKAASNRAISRDFDKLSALLTRFGLSIYKDPDVDPSQPFPALVGKGWKIKVDPILVRTQPGPTEAPAPTTIGEIVLIIDTPEYTQEKPVMKLSEILREAQAERLALSSEPTTRALERMWALVERGKDVAKGTMQRLNATSDPGKIAGIYWAAKKWGLPEVCSAAAKKYKDVTGKPLPK